MFFRRKKKYWVSLDSEDWVAPEETLLDSNSHYSDIEKPIAGGVFRFFFISLTSLLVVILAFVVKIGFFEHEVFANLAFQNKSANFPLPAPRGMIFDRYEKPLAKNAPVFNLLVISREIWENREGANNYTEKIAGILNQDGPSFSKLVEDNAKLHETFFAFKDLTKDQVLAIEYLEPKGFYIVPDMKREYISGSKFSQIIGYTGKVNKEDIKDDYYNLTDVIGRLGVEYQYENFLRGAHGNIFFAKGESGHITKDPNIGKSLILGVDHDLQIKLYDELFTILRDSGISRAAAVAQDPRSGAIRALISFPSFDNNIFSSEISETDYRNLFESKSKPLFNRIISGLYNPGSTIKPYIGMTALEEKVSNAETSVEDCISITIPNPYDVSNPYVFKNWRNEFGLFNLKKSIANSCNIYFYSVGGGHGKIKGLGIERIAKYLSAGMADSSLGIDLPGEVQGFIPTPEWKIREKGEPWYLGDTYNTSIGQGDLLVTPLWLNAQVSAIANGGTIYKPRIVSKVIGDNREVIEEYSPEEIGKLPFSQETISLVKNAMAETINSGTAQVLSQIPVKMGAKTGTAEVIKGKTVNSLFTVFAPYDNPEIAMTILIEGATSQQGLAVRAAYQVLNWYFGERVVLK